jgi:cell wall-associated NlpC family hydrolase
MAGRLKSCVAAALRFLVGPVVLALIVALGAGAPAGAAPGPQEGPDQLLARYKDLGNQAEQASEAMNQAQVDFTQRSNDLRQAQQAQRDADRTLAGLQVREAALQKDVDSIARASYMGARVNRLYAVLVSDSPQSLLDQMSTLEVVSRKTTRQIRDFKQTRAAAEKARNEAQQAENNANTAIQAVNKTRSDLQSKQSKLQMQILQVKSVYEAMTGKQLAALVGPTISFDPRLIPPGTSAATIAVQAALSRIGDPYVWGATGPDQFDCSGLMVWAYKQAGKTIPRTSEAQQAGGKPVSRNDMQPGDLVIYYSDAHHVGMYIGDGYVVHASTFGVPVKVATVDGAGPFASAVRYS